jgi:hypothetical protein
LDSLRILQYQAHSEREGCDTPTATRLLKTELRDFARNNNIELSDCRKQIATGWEGQPKGLLQVLGERELIERDLLDKCTLDGRKDHITGIVDLQFLLQNIMAECTDFKPKEMACQYLGLQLGVTDRFTPAFHAELAGECVEYSWAHANAYYQSMPLSRKQGCDNFKQLVRDCTCPVNVLTKERIEKFASRARACICTYHHHQQEHQKLQQTAAANEDPNAVVAQTKSSLIPKQQILYSKIEG